MRLIIGIPVFAAAVFIAWSPRPSPSLRAEDAKDGAEEEEEEKQAEPTPREKQVLALFNASSKRFEKGRLVLTYDFESSSRSDDLVEDWRPALDETKKRVRWAQGLEGTVTTVEHGILIGDFGEWIHKAIFLPDATVKVDTLSVAQFRPGTIVAPIFFSEKKKRSLGVTGGYQAVCLSGCKQARPPHPKTEKPIPTNLRQNVGYRFDGKVLESYLNGKKTSDTSAAPRFTEGFDTGHVGLAWNGSVQCFIFQVTMEGRLDPDWVSKQLGEKPEKPEKPAPAPPSAEPKKEPGKQPKSPPNPPKKAAGPSTKGAG